MTESLQERQSAVATAPPTALNERLRLELLALSLLRAVAGFSFAIYGAQLLFGFFGGSGGTGHPEAPFSLLWFAGILEFFGGLLVGLGLFTKPVAFVLSGQMAFAFFLAHFPHGLNPASNGGETSVLFCFIFLYLATAGPGRSLLAGCGALLRTMIDNRG
jgi:putative oxidoreductase